MFNSVPLSVTHCRYPGTELGEDGYSQVLIPNLTATTSSCTWTRNLPLDAELGRYGNGEAGGGDQKFDSDAHHPGDYALSQVAEKVG
jgi:hypothetical protein